MHLTGTLKSKKWEPHMSFAARPTWSPTEHSSTSTRNTGSFNAFHTMRRTRAFCPSCNQPLPHFVVQTRCSPSALAPASFLHPLIEPKLFTSTIRPSTFSTTSRCRAYLKVLAYSLGYRSTPSRNPIEWSAGEGSRARD